MRVIDTNAYIGTLRELTEQGKEVSMIITGSSMAPFLIHQRDVICFKKPDRELRKGDMVFYQRPTGQYVMHRIYKVRPDGYEIIGDAQTETESSVKREQIFALITKVKRKEHWICPNDLIWKFFEKFWLNMIPMRPIMMKILGKLSNLR